MIVVEVADGRDRGIVRWYGDRKSRHLWQSTVVKRAAESHALVQVVLLWKQFDLEVVEYGQLPQ